MASWAEHEPARALGAAITTAVAGAAGGDRRVYERAVVALDELPTAPTGSVLGAVVRLLVEDGHPGGLDGDDIRAVLGRCLADAATGLPGAAISTRVLIAVLSSALGIHEAGVTYVELLPPAAPEAGGWVDPEPVPAARPADAPRAADDSSPPTAGEYNWHAPLLIASLLVVAPRPLTRYLDAAFADIARSETMEMP